MKISYQISNLIILIIAVSSCSIEKRVYNSGYHIEWNDSKSKNGVTVSNKFEKEQSAKVLDIMAIEQISSKALKLRVENNFFHAKDIDRSIAVPKKEKHTSFFNNTKSKIITQQIHFNLKQIDTKK